MGGGRNSAQIKICLKDMASQRQTRHFKKSIAAMEGTQSNENVIFVKRGGRTQARGER